MLWYCAQSSHQLCYGTVLSPPMQYATLLCLVFLCTVLWYCAQSSYLLCCMTVLGPPMQCVVVLCSVVLCTSLWDCAQTSCALCYGSILSLPEYCIVICALSSRTLSPTLRASSAFLGQNTSRSPARGTRRARATASQPDMQTGQLPMVLGQADICNPPEITEGGECTSDPDSYCSRLSPSSVGRQAGDRVCIWKC